MGSSSHCSRKNSKLDIIITDNKAPEQSVQKAVACDKELLIVNPDTLHIEAHYNKRD